MANGVDMVLRQRGKRNLARVERWATDALEKIGAKCKAISNSKSVQDWEIFLRSIYEAVTTLTNLQRTILLLSQEFGIPRREIARVIGVDPFVVHSQYNRAVAKVVAFLDRRSLLRPLRSLDECSPVIIRKYGGRDVIDCIKSEAGIARVGDRELSEHWKSARGEMVHGAEEVQAERVGWRRCYLYSTKRILEAG